MSEFVEGLRFNTAKGPDGKPVVLMICIDCGSLVPEGWQERHSNAHALEAFGLGGLASAFFNEEPKQ